MECAVRSPGSRSRSVRMGVNTESTGRRGICTAVSLADGLMFSALNGALQACQGPCWASHSMSCVVGQAVQHSCSIRVHVKKTLRL